MDDAIDGQAIKACVVATNGTPIAEQRIRQHCRARLESYMIPKYIEVRETLPKTSSGKIRRRES